MTHEDLKAAIARGALVKHHVAYAKGYYSRRAEPTVSAYKGRYGAGYIVDSAAYNTTRYHLVTYYITPQKENAK